MQNRRKCVVSGSSKDLWLVVREGSVADVDSVLALVKKSGGNVNARNQFGLTPLHSATWRNHIPIVRRLLAAGADPNARDGESGWSSLHRALHFGHLAVASVLIQAGASITLEDSKSRTPIDLLSGPVFEAVGSADNSVMTEVFSWGSGVNYQLETGNAEPCDDCYNMELCSLHRAIQAGASITLEDSKSGTPIDLLSGPVFQAVGSGDNSVTTEVFSWGSGVNYQLGTGNAHIQKLPCKVDSLNGSFIKLISAAKFHNVAVSACGEVYTWGFGRGGRLGHPGFYIHSGQAAVITPRQVTGLGARRVKAIAAAKHHTIIATEGGEVFTWGSNREGQLGYTSVDTQATPRRVSSLKSKIVAVAAANKHTAVVSDSGEVFTWGCNKEGQLGYGTSNSASNYTPRAVEYLKGKVLVAVAAAKYHTVVLGADGEVFTWGHRLVTPKCVVISRNLKKVGNTLLKFHRKERLHVVAIAAGITHSMALMDDGSLFFWVSSDPDLRCQQLYSLCGRNIVSITAGKYWSAAVTVTGDVYMWDGKNRIDEPPTVTRLHGVKKATSVAVGETHLSIVSSLYHPVYPPNIVYGPHQLKLKVKGDLDELYEGFAFDELDSGEVPSMMQQDEVTSRNAPSLKSLCEKVAVEHLVEPQNALTLLEIADSLGADDLKSLCEKVAAEHLVEPRNAVTLLEIADSLGANDLRKHCEEIALRNMDYIFAVSAHAISSTSLDILVHLEKLLDLKSSEPWSYRQLPTPTATFPAIINSEEEDSENEFPRSRDDSTKKLASKKVGGERLDSFLKSYDVANEGVSKQVRALRKKLQQIEMLEEKQSKRHPLDDQQIAKLKTRPILESSLAELGVPVEMISTRAPSSVPMDGKGSKKVELSRKQRRKSKQKESQLEEPSMISEVIVETSPIKSSLDVEIPQDMLKDVLVLERAASNKEMKDSNFGGKKDALDAPKNKSSSTSASKKKNRKVGLSMFLSGALDDVPKVALPPTMPKSEGPAWGGAKISKGPSSICEIQNEQSKTKDIKPMMPKDHLGELSEGDIGGKVPLSTFLPSNPIPVVSARTAQVSDGERNTPPWAASGTPPSLSRPSLRDILLQQGKHHQGLSPSPKTITTGQGSLPDSGGPSRWFKPEVDLPSTICSIQIKERATKDLKRF